MKKTALNIMSACLSLVALMALSSTAVASMITVEYLFGDGPGRDSYGGMSMNTDNVNNGEWSLEENYAEFVASGNVSAWGLLDLSDLGRTAGTDFSVTLTGSYETIGQNQGFRGGVGALTNDANPDSSVGYYGAIIRPQEQPDTDNPRLVTLSDTSVLGQNAANTIALEVPDTTHNSSAFTITLAGTYNVDGHLSLSTEIDYAAGLFSLSTDSPITDPHTGVYFGPAARLQSDTTFRIEQMDITFVPEPATGGLLMAGMAGLLILVRRRRLRG